MVPLRGLTNERSPTRDQTKLRARGIIVQHGLTESMQDAVQRALDAGIKVVAFDVNVDNPQVPQVEQSDRDLARLALEQAITDELKLEVLKLAKRWKPKK